MLIQSSVIFFPAQRGARTDSAPRVPILKVQVFSFMVFMPICCSPPAWPSLVSGRCWDHYGLAAAYRPFSRLSRGLTAYNPGTTRLSDVEALTGVLLFNLPYHRRNALPFAFLRLAPCRSAPEGASSRCRRKACRYHPAGRRFDP